MCRNRQQYLSNQSYSTGKVKYLFNQSLLLAQRQCNVYLSSYIALFSWLGLMLYDGVNSYAHVRMVSSPNHTFFLGMLD